MGICRLSSRFFILSTVLPFCKHVFEALTRRRGPRQNPWDDCWTFPRLNAKHAVKRGEVVRPEGQVQQQRRLARAGSAPQRCAFTIQQTTRFTHVIMWPKPRLLIGPYVASVVLWPGSHDNGICDIYPEEKLHFSDWQPQSPRKPTHVWSLEDIYCVCKVSLFVRRSWFVLCSHQTCWRSNCWHWGTHSRVCVYLFVIKPLKLFWSISWYIVQTWLCQRKC